MVDFGPQTAEICWRVWACTPANFNGFRVLAALLHGTLVVSVSQTAGLNRGRHLYSAGRPSRWALAHILVYNLSAFVYSQTPSHCMKLTVLINHITDTAQSQASKLRSHAPFAASVTMLNLNGIERANAQRDGRPAKYRWLVAPSVQRRKVWLTPTTRCRAVTLPRRETR